MNEPSSFSARATPHDHDDANSTSLPRHHSSDPGDGDGNGNDNDNGNLVTLLNILDGEEVLESMVPKDDRLDNLPNGSSSGEEPAEQPLHKHDNNDNNNDGANQEWNSKKWVEDILVGRKTRSDHEVGPIAAADANTPIVHTTTNNNNNNNNNNNKRKLDSPWKPDGIGDSLKQASPSFKAAAAIVRRDAVDDISVIVDDDNYNNNDGGNDDGDKKPAAKPTFKRHSQSSTCCQKSNSTTKSHADTLSRQMNDRSNDNNDNNTASKDTGSRAVTLHWWAFSNAKALQHYKRHMHSILKEAAVWKPFQPRPDDPYRGAPQTGELVSIIIRGEPSSALYRVGVVTSFSATSDGASLGHVRFFKDDTNQASTSNTTTMTGPCPSVEFRFTKQAFQQEQFRIRCDLHRGAECFDRVQEQYCTLKNIDVVTGGVWVEYHSGDDADDDRVRQDGSTSDHGYREMLRCISPNDLIALDCSQYARASTVNNIPDKEKFLAAIRKGNVKYNKPVATKEEEEEAKRGNVNHGKPCSRDVEVVASAAFGRGAKKTEPTDTSICVGSIVGVLLGRREHEAKVLKIPSPPAVHSTTNFWSKEEDSASTGGKKLLVEWVSRRQRDWIDCKSTQVRLLGGRRRGVRSGSPNRASGSPVRKKRSRGSVTSPPDRPNNDIHANKIWFGVRERTGRIVNPVNGSTSFGTIGYSRGKLCSLESGSVVLLEGELVTYIFRRDPRGHLEITAKSEFLLFDPFHGNLARVTVDNNGYCDVVLGNSGGKDHLGVSFPSLDQVGRLAVWQRLQSCAKKAEMEHAHRHRRKELSKGDMRPLQPVEVQLKGASGDLEAIVTGIPASGNLVKVQYCKKHAQTDDSSQVFCESISISELTWVGSRDRWSASSR